MTHPIPGADSEHDLFQREMLKMGIKENFLERSKLGDDGYQHPTVHERWLGFHACYAAAKVGATSDFDRCTKADDESASRADEDWFFHPND